LGSQEEEEELSEEEVDEEVSVLQEWLQASPTSPSDPQQEEQLSQKN